MEWYQLAPDGDRFPAARGARSLNLWGRRDRTFHGLKGRALATVVYLSWLLVGYGRCGYLPLFSNSLVSSWRGDRPLSATDFASRFPSFELEARFQPTPDVVHHKGPLVERPSKGREKLRANSLNI